jgi:hypothetical protein
MPSPAQERTGATLFLAANAVSAVAFLLLIQDPRRPLVPIAGLVAVAVLLTFLAIWVERK